MLSSYAGGDPTAIPPVASTVSLEPAAFVERLTTLLPSMTASASKTSPFSIAGIWSGKALVACHNSGMT